MKVIALTGRAGSGKDTSALMLQILTGATPHPYLEGTLDMQSIVPWCLDQGLPFDQLNDHECYSVHKFSWPVYQIGAIILGLDPYDMMTPKWKLTKNVWNELSGREFLQKIGTECFRGVLGEDTWIRKMDRTIRLAKGQKEGIIISDLRFLNEAAFLHGAGALIIKLIGRDSGVPLTHQSESELDEIKPDYTVQNTGTYAELMQHLSGICKHHKILNCKYTWK